MAPAGRARALMIVPGSRERFDGLRDFSRLLAAALAPSQDVEVVTGPGDRGPAGALRTWKTLPSRPRPDVVYVNYQPVAWLRVETFGLLRALRRWRGAGARVVVIAHEYQIDAGPTVRRAAGRVLLRRLARAFASRADTFVTTHGFTADLARADGIERMCPIATIPVGSNVNGPAAPPAGAAGRGLIMFGQPAGMHASITAAAARAAAEARQELVWMCRSADEVRRWMARHGIAPESIRLAEGLSAEAAGEALSRAAIGLAPIIDGVSTRRTTVAAMLQHGLPVVGTAGRATDRLFFDSPAFALAPVGDTAGFLRALERVSGDTARRAHMSAAGRALFDAHLAWPRIAGRYLELGR